MQVPRIQASLPEERKSRPSVGTAGVAAVAAGLCACRGLAAASFILQFLPPAPRNHPAQGREVQVHPPLPRGAVSAAVTVGRALGCAGTGTGTVLCARFRSGQRPGDVLAVRPPPGALRLSSPPTLPEGGRPPKATRSDPGARAHVAAKCCPGALGWRFSPFAKILFLKFAPQLLIEVGVVSLFILGLSTL